MGIDMKMLGVVGVRSATHSEMVLEDQFFVLCFRPLFKFVVGSKFKKRKSRREYLVEK